MRSMKTYKPLQLILLILSILSLSGCMPDSFTKFEEDPPVSSQGASATPTPTPIPVNPPENFSYNDFGGDFIEDHTVGSPVVDFTPTTIDNFPDSYSINPALPTGLSFNTATGEISGTPTVYTPRTTYVVTATNAAGSTSCNIILSTLNPPTGLRLTAQPRVLVTVINAASFFVGGQIAASNGGVATIEQIEGNRITALMTSGSFSSIAPDNDVDPGATYLAPATTTIDEVDYTLVQKLKVASTASFTTGGYVSSPLGHYGVVIEIIDATEMTVGVLNGTFNAGDVIDDLESYVATADTIQEVSFIYEADEGIDIRPTIATGEEIKYRIFPDEVLPVAFDGFNEDFGFVIGEQSGSDLYTFTLQAENAVGTDTVVFSVGPEESAPKNMNFSQALLLNVTGTSAFKVGDEITSGIGANAGSATILRIIDNSNLYVRLNYGYFPQGAAIDNVFPFGGEKATINSFLPVNTVLYVGDGQGATFGRNGYISSFGNVAQGIVAHMDPSDITQDVIYAFTYKGSFIVGDATTLTIDNEENYLAAAATVSNIEAPNLRLRVNSVAAFEKGSQITDAAGSAGHVMDMDATNLDLYVEVNNQGFDYNNAVDDIDDFNPYAAVATDITQVSPDNTFYLYRDVPTRINAFLRKGSSPTWTISPNLPEGLEIDVDQGHISGTPTKSSSKKVYVVTATNLIDGNVNTETFTFSMQVLDHFTITNETTDATSYILHKEGRKNGSSSCTITRDQILSSDLSVKDIVCRLEGEEQDLFQHGIDLKVVSSAGLCQFVYHRPYTFNFRPPTKTSNHTVYHINGLAPGSDCVPPASDNPIGAPTKNKCISDYGMELTAPANCDAGTYTERQVAWENGGADSGAPCLAVAGYSDNVFSCAGNPRLCRQGALQEMTYDGSSRIDDQRFDAISLPASTGRTTVFNYRDPLTDPSFGSIVKLANYVGNNSCAEAAAGSAQGYLYGTLNWDLYSTSGTNLIPSVPANSPLQREGTFIGTVDFPAATAASPQADRSTLTTAGDYRAAIFPGDIITIDWGAAGGIGHHRVDTITAGTISFNGGTDFEFSVGGANYNGPYNIYYGLHTDPFKGFLTNPYYTYECRDAAQDTIARIRIQVREWDRAFSQDDDIDLLSTATTGTVSTSVGTQALTGAGSLFSTELSPNQMFRVGNQVNYVSSITNDTNLVMRDNSPATLAGQTLYSRPLLMDAGDSTDVFLQLYNDYADWDDRNNNVDSITFRGRYPYKNSCNAAAPIADPNSREYFYDFVDQFLK